MRRAIAGVALAVLAPAAFAHAFLERAEPRVGSAVAKAPDHVTLRFSEALEPAFSSVEVLDAGGRRVDRNDRTVDPGDAAVMRVSVPALGPGRYRVKWRALSADTHVTQGDFTFEVGR
ncbi:MAG TPA: copper resistance CopC family protein [Usitatibacter sp.]|nr:copper resistance CopC family protein [Usitatibacter sp.]